MRRLLILREKERTVRVREQVNLALEARLLL